jgi:hypothetical protein
MSRYLYLAAACMLLAACVAAGGGRRTLQSRTGQPVQGAPKSVAPKVLVLNFDPIIESEGGKRLHEVAKWNDPRYLADAYTADLQECSGGYARYNVVEWKDVDAYPVKKDGFRYTDEEFLKCLRTGKGWHQPDAIDYKALIREFHLDKRVSSGEIDEVWVMGMPYSGMWESTMAGKGAYFCNSDPVPDVDCPRIFVIMGFNYERGVGEMLEDMGHRTESIMTHVYGSWDPKPTHAWNRFTLRDKDIPGQSACGNVHFSPNSKSDYEWGNHAYVQSTCDDWLDYPMLTGKKRLMNASDWGNGYIRSHHKWWLTRLPKAAGRGPDGKLANWWGYTVDFNRYPESNGNKSR